MNNRQNQKKDRLEPYLKKYMNLFVFDEFTPAYLQREGLEGVMRGVAVPFRSSQFSAFLNGDGLRITDMIENMVWVLGVDPDFAYLQQYKAYMKHYFKEGLSEGIEAISIKAAEEGDLEKACLLVRGAMAIDSQNMDALYLYAGICRQIYQKAAGEGNVKEIPPHEVGEYIGRFKAESMEAYEELTIGRPDFAPAHYYLGYAYLNMGLYRKAQLTLKDYLKHSSDEETIGEIKDRLKQLEEPIRIEEGCNAISAGKWEEGIQVLEPYLASDYRMWWPLHYYLGIAYVRIGMLSDGEERLKDALSLVPSQVDCMEELADIYGMLGDVERENKYRKKIEILTGELIKDN
ncbi:MAG: tetratricopeptide repeat protein [Anaerovoracaceae bacterium]|jgi:tetratricopeptide (TPR) repeat protein